jgi:hypothetical protein
VPMKLLLRGELAPQLTVRNHVRLAALQDLTNSCAVVQADRSH